MTYFHFGSVTIPAIWIATLISLFISSALFRITKGEKIGDWYWNGFLIYFFIWKLSYILFHLNMFLDLPLSIIYYNGGIKGHFLALFGLSFYILLIAMKNSMSRDLTQIFLVFFISYEVITSILENSFMEALCHSILLVSFLFLLYFSKKKVMDGQVYILIFMLEVMIFSLFNSILSFEAMTFTWMGTTTIILSFYHTSKEGPKT